MLGAVKPKIIGVIQSRVDAYFPFCNLNQLDSTSLAWVILHCLDFSQHLLFFFLVMCWNKTLYKRWNPSHPCPSHKPWKSCSATPLASEISVGNAHTFFKHALIATRTRNLLFWLKLKWWVPGTHELLRGWEGHYLYSGRIWQKTWRQDPGRCQLNC